MSDCYSEVRNVITQGGLFRTIVFPSKDISLKIKNPSFDDLDWTYEYSPTQAWKRELAFVARSLHSINGRHIQSSEDALYWVVDFLQTLSPSLLRTLISYNFVLLEQSRKAHSFLEAFCYEHESRSLWSQWKAHSAMGFDLSRGLFQNLNVTQSSWVSWNQAEDERVRVRVEWEQALLVTSAFNHKGAQEIRNNWKSEDQANEDYRNKVCQLARSGVTDFEKERSLLKNRLDSFDDLKEEMRKWLAGEEDEHDRAIREYKSAMYQKIEDDKRRAEEIREASRRRIQDINEIRASASPIRAYTDDEIKYLSPSTKKFKQTNEHAERFEHVKERYITARETTGNLTINEEGEIVSNKPQEPSLMDQIKNRTPSI